MLKYNVNNSVPLATHYFRLKGVSLVFVLILLVFLVVVLANVSSLYKLNTIRTSSLIFDVKSQWISENICDEWLQYSQQVSVDEQEKLLGSQIWKIEDIKITIDVSSSQEKLFLHDVNFEQIQFLLSRNNIETPFGTEIKNKIRSEHATLESIFYQDRISAKTVYIPDQKGITTIGSLFTLYGSGKIDINRASQLLLSARFKGLTDAQINGIIRIRNEKRITDISTVADELSMSSNQRETFQNYATTSIDALEILISIEQGGYKAVFLGVIDIGKNKNIILLRMVI